ncbi:Alpha/Beta hydrolase protein [Mycena rosella]|uniref:Alpha/Beta hydrolase protein n=1 Tax=Mycena rosella TaxID=1033263 RepID=A0AAD7BMA8_MYCRO|nr:Alpha/Beta hydrolase protein [Mycena rosella]
MRRFELLLIFCGVVTAASPQVKLDYATYVGTSLAAGVNQFLGMRFAAPPLGNRRWRAPEDPLVETSPVQASAYGSICYNLGAAFDPTATTLSEDCLFIDVYSPSGASETSELPVWFFIQGGGYIQNSNANYNGTGVIVESGRNIVVVNFNYRVSAFGFLASERVARDGTLNFGLLDQRKALLWVQKYISKFGSDPNHVVIHGVSAGLLNRISGCGGSVTHHLTAFGGCNDGLFIGAIGDSVFWPREAPVPELEFQFDLFAAAAGCINVTDQIACLRTQNTSTLVAANVVHSFQGRLYPLRSPLPNHAPFFPSAAAANFIAAQINRVRQLVWNYRFSVVQANDATAGLGVPHASELPAIFGPAFIPGGSSTTFATTNAPIVPVVMNYCISFIRSLNPNPHRFFNATNQRRLKFVLNDTHVEEIPVNENMRCAFWNEIGARIEQ